MRSMFFGFNFMIFIILFLTLFTYTPPTYGVEPTKNEQHPPSEGNLALSSSQQPKSLVSFGGNIFEKGTLQLTVVSSYSKGIGQYATVIDPDLIYAFSDKSSILLDVPYAVRLKQLGDNESADEGMIVNTKQYSSGIQDMFLQLEHEVYTSSTSCYEDQITVLGAVYFPTGNHSKNPPTGAGAPSYFLGATYDLTRVDWFYFTSQGVLLPSSHHGNKNGNEYIYQFGVGRNLCAIKEQYIFDFILEATGQYTGKDKVMGVIDPDSGGNAIFLTPSLWFSTKKLVFQFGVSYPIAQHLIGDQPKEHYILLSSFSYTF